MNSTLQHYIDILKENEAILAKEYLVKRIGIFGSIARGSFSDTSDIDVLVEFSGAVGFFKFIELERFLTDILGRKVDLATPGALKSLIKQKILTDTIYA